MNIYIFAYGSLMNQLSREKTLPGIREILPARLRGYQRKMNAPVNQYLYANIVRRPFKSVDGVLIRIEPAEFAQLRAREIGYTPVEVTKELDRAVQGKAYAFIAPDQEYPDLTIPQSYIDTCVAFLSRSARAAWIRNTIITNPVLNDRRQPVYVNAVKSIVNER